MDIDFVTSMYRSQYISKADMRACYDALKRARKDDSMAHDKHYYDDDCILL